MPLLGNPTAAVLYPGKLVFALFKYPLAARIYVIAHTLLAFGAMLALCHHWRMSWAGSTLGASAYAFGGPVLFQDCNVIFLVGAAWLPLGFRAADRWLGQGRRIAMAELAVVLAMENLGGDPESAYLTGVCAAAYAVGLARRGRKFGLSTGALVAIVAAWVVSTLAAAQWAPGLRIAARPDQPRGPFPWTPWVGPTVLAAWLLAGLALVARWRRMRRGGERPVLVPMLSGLVVAAVLAAAVSAAQLFPVLEFIAQSSPGRPGRPRQRRCVQPPPGPRDRVRLAQRVRHSLPRQPALDRRHSSQRRECQSVGADALPRRASRSCWRWEGSGPGVPPKPPLGGRGCSPWRSSACWGVSAARGLRSGSPDWRPRTGPSPGSKAATVASTGSWPPPCPASAISDIRANC